MSKSRRRVTSPKDLFAYRRFMEWRVALDNRTRPASRAQALANMIGWASR